jgi:hypothetical protein
MQFSKYEGYKHPRKVIEEEYKINKPKEIMYKDIDFNDHQHKLQIDNYRLKKYTKNKNFFFKKDQIYDLLAIDDGEGPGKNPDLDSKITRGNLQTKPISKLAEKTNWERQRKEFVTEKINKTQFTHDPFLVGTTISNNPQKNFNPGFDIYGINTRHYVRKSDRYYKSM